MTPSPFEVDGHRLDWELRPGARGDSPTVLLVHGLTLDRRILVEGLDASLARRGLARLYFDLPGHGRSTGERSRARADDLVDAIAALARSVLDRAGGPPLLVGHSYGGYLAQALVEPLGPRALLLVCPVVEPEHPRRTLPPKRVARRDEPLAFLDEHERETFEEVAVAQTAPVLAAYRRAVYPASVATDRAFVAAVRERYAVARPNAPSLRAFAGPAAIACGRDDHWVGFEDAIRIARLLPRSSMHVLADCGHLLMLEEPARFAALVEDWLDRALAEPPAAPSAR